MSKQTRRRVGKPRGRFDVMFVFDHGASLRVTSRKDRSLSVSEVCDELRRLIANIEGSFHTDGGASDE